MLSIKTLQYLADLLLEIAKGEKTVEVIRQQLGGHEQFEPYSSFRRLDEKRKKFLVSEDIQQFLRQNNISTTIEQCNIFIFALAGSNCMSNRDANDSSHDSNEYKVTYNKFLREVLSYENRELRETVSQRLPINKLELQKDVEQSLAKLINQEIQSGISVYDRKSALLSRTDFSIKGCFEELDKFNKGYIDGQDLYTFLRKSGQISYEDDIVSLHRRLDYDQDGLISLQDLSNGLLIQGYEHKQISLSVNSKNRSLSSNNHKVYNNEKITSSINVSDFSPKNSQINHNIPSYQNIPTKKLNINLISRDSLNDEQDSDDPIKYSNDDRKKYSNDDVSPKFLYENRMISPKEKKKVINNMQSPQSSIQREDNRTKYIQYSNPSKIQKSPAFQGRSPKENEEVIRAEIDEYQDNLRKRIRDSSQNARQKMSSLDYDDEEQIQAQKQSSNYENNKLQQQINKLKLQEENERQILELEVRMVEQRRRQEKVRQQLEDEKRQKQLSQRRGGNQKLNSSPQSDDPKVKEILQLKQTLKKQEEWLQFREQQEQKINNSYRQKLREQEEQRQREYEEQKRRELEEQRLRKLEELRQKEYEEQIIKEKERQRELHEQQIREQQEQIMREQEELRRIEQEEQRLIELEVQRIREKEQKIIRETKRKLTQDIQELNEEKKSRQQQQSSDQVARNQRAHSSLSGSNTAKRDSYDAQLQESDLTQTKRRIVYSRDNRKNWQEQLSNLFLDVIDNDKRLERNKQDLALRPDFKQEDLFCVMDITSSGLVNAIQFKEFLSSLSITVSVDDIYLLMRRYDADNDQSLNLEDISKATTPLQSEYAKLIKKRKTFFEQGNNNVFSAETERILRVVFESLIQSERMIQQVRKTIANNHQFGIEDTFELIDSDNNGLLTHKEIKEFLEGGNVYCSNKEIDTLMSRFGAHSSNKDISYFQFLMQLSQEEIN